MRSVREALRWFVGTGPLCRLGVPLMRGRLCIFTLHRFKTLSSETIVPGMDLALLSRILDYVRREEYNLISLQAALDALLDPTKLRRRSVVFTVDDGYADFAPVAEVFLKYDCPVTVFICTGFIDGKMWPSCDQIEWTCAHAEPGEVMIPLGDGELRFQFGAHRDEQDLRRLVQRLWNCSKGVSDDERWEFVSSLAKSAHVEIPERPPASYMPLSWDQVRELRDRGIDFAPHTVTHPILSQTSDVQAQWEIEESWRRLSQEVAGSIPILAYPNGLRGDYGEREIEIIESVGLEAAVTLADNYASCAGVSRNGRGRYEIPRFGQPVDLPDFAMTASGLTRITQVIPRSLRRHIATPCSCADGVAPPGFCCRVPGCDRYMLPPA
jgi:peptidoglycan/xylan/chitin deacetylase (PgdA/CDA1 family)